VTTRWRVSSGTGPYSPVQEGSDAATHPAASDPASPLGEGSDAATHPAASGPPSLLRRALAPPHVPRLQTPPPHSEGFQHRHVSHDYLPGTNKEVFGCNG
jgi:hypothetical protein